MLRLADAFLGSGPPLDAADQARLLAHFEPAQIVELSAGLALFQGFSKIAIALGEIPEEMPVLEVPTPDLA